MPEFISLKIEKVVAGGEGLARHEGRVVFVSNVLPGEEVRVEVVEAKKDFARAELRDILQASPDRVIPPCSLAGTCGGCDWLHIDSKAQARLKIEITRDALRRVAGMDWPDLEIETGSVLGYRNRLQLHTDGHGSLGFLRRGSHGLVPVKNCPVAHLAFGPLFAKGASPKSPDRFHAFAWQDSEGKPHLWREDEQPGAEARVSILGRELAFPVRGFFQSNLEMLQRLIPYAIRGLSGDVVLDLYAGVGLFGFFLKPHYRKVVCVESNSEALRYAKQNIGVDGAEFVQGQIEEIIDRPGFFREGGLANAILVDPPREGLDSKVRGWLKKQAVSKLVYVACNPVTLARDLKDLSAGPYVLEDLRLFDFYPQTSHIEAVAKLKIK